MSLLVKLELQKLIRRKYLFVGAILLIIYTLFWFFVCAVNHAATFPIHTKNGCLLEGRQAALYNKVLYEQYAGELTDEKVAEILDDFQTLRNRYETTHSDLFNAPLIYEDFCYGSCNPLCRICYITLWHILRWTYRVAS